MTATLNDIQANGARITYMLAQDTATGRPIAMGIRPHCTIWTLIRVASQCAARITLTNEVDADTFEERCTREARHTGQHVVHVKPGLPSLAWLVDRHPEPSDSSSTGGQL